MAQFISPFDFKLYCREDSFMFVPNQESHSANYLHGLMKSKEIKMVAVGVAVVGDTTEEGEEVEGVAGEEGVVQVVWMLCFLLEPLKLNNRNVF